MTPHEREKKFAKELEALCNKHGVSVQVRVRPVRVNGAEVVPDFDVYYVARPDGASDEVESDGK